jgi:uncharacterized protein (TIGR03435 family)
MMRGPVMQRLLQERFGLKIHREAREVPVYLMTAVEGGAMLQPSVEGSCRALDPLILRNRCRCRLGANHGA